MRTYLDCIPCFFNQALWAARMITQDERKIKKILNEIGLMVKDIPLESSPPETGRLVYKKIREILDVPDPFKEIIVNKYRESVKFAKSVVSVFRNVIPNPESVILNLVQNLFRAGLFRNLKIIKRC